MYGRVVIYTFDEDKDALEAKARAGVIPLVTGTPGYLAYGVMFTEDRVVSSSAWESEDHAKAGDAALLEWVQANTTMKVDERFTGDLSWLELAGQK
jgi:heme-degrading monooxygenase HmoA